MHTPAYPTPDASIFKAYDIRGIVDKTLDGHSVKAIGHALGSQAKALQQRCIAVGRDGRLSGPRLASALAEGIMAAGVDVIDIGCVPTPLSYFAAYQLGTHSCVSVTGSHNPPDYNGLKMVLGGETLHGTQIQALRQRIVDNDLSHGHGQYCQQSVSDAYIERIAAHIQLARPMKIVIDCGNGVAGAIAPALLKSLGCELIELYCDVDGHFPNHHPDPSKPENLKDLVEAVQQNHAELGLAFDGDGDRLGVVTRDGDIIYPDRQLMLFAEDVLQRVPGAEIIYDVKCSRNLKPWIEARGGQATMWNTGHALIKAKLRETGAALAGEMSGHMFFKERWYGFDDGLYAAARLLEILSRHPDANPVLKQLPDALSTPELNIQMQEGEPFELIKRLKTDAQFDSSQEIITLDGVRVEYADGFGLARASNTTPVVVLRFEAETESSLQRIQQEFRAALKKCWPSAVLPF